MEQPLFENINIIGLGLIGGSIAKACRKYGLSKKIFAFDIDQSQIDFALKIGIIDGVYDFKDKNHSDLIIICSPLFTYKEILQRISPISEKSIIIDVGSLKEFVLPLTKEILKEKSGNFIACHPIAGSDKSGIVHSLSDLFLSKKIIITPDISNDKNDINKVELFWKRIGSNPELMDARLHDKIFSLVSHLPQFLSFIAKEDFKNDDDEILNRHFRLQNSNPKMWQEIFALNRTNIEYYLKEFTSNIDKLIQNLNDQEDVTQKQNDELILRRLSLVMCFINIPDIEIYKEHSGSGFKDFTAILEYQNKLQNLVNHKESLTQFLKEIKDKINHYEFS